MSETQMNVNEIIKHLPHRYPFLLVDRILECKVNEYILGVKNVTINEPFFAGHFPAKPVMPGVLILESLAQAAGILAYRSTDWDPKTSLFYLGAIDKVKFKKIVSPGDQLMLKINVTHRRTNVWKFKGEALVDGKVVCSMEMTSTEGKVSD